MTDPRGGVQLVIEELVLEGFTAADGETIRRAAEHRLARHDDARPRPADVDAVTLTTTASPAGIGERLAAAVLAAVHGPERTTPEAAP